MRVDEVEEMRMDFEEIRKAMGRAMTPCIPDYDRKIRWDEHKLVFGSAEELERTKAMIEFCTNYEPELFQMFYKWFKKERKEN